MAEAVINKGKNDLSMQNIKVVVRVRPLNTDEIEKQVRNVVFCESHKDIKLKERKYIFDQVFKPNSKQIDIYMYVVGPMIADVLDGYNCTVFAYGPTGTGKTHTMIGTNSNISYMRWKEDISSGCIPRAAAHIFEKLASMNVYEFNVRISFLELYNEEVRDLLSDDENPYPLNIYNDPKKSVYIQNLKEISVFNTNDVNMLLEKGSNRRQTSSTRINNRSSRSHAVFTITVHTKELNYNGEEILKTGKINLVDLAGSENIAKSGAKDKRAQESMNINKSLLTLGRVIHILAEKTSKYIPYRDSKLTRILQDSLGGHSKTCIIATVSPSDQSAEETQNTLDYASRARDIKNTPTMNAKVTKAEMLKEMFEEIDKLKLELEIVRNKGDGFFIDRTNWEEMNKEREGANNAILLKKEVIANMETEMENLTKIYEARSRDFDYIMDICKKHKQTVNKAKDELKKWHLSLKQEQYVSKYYENLAVDVSSETTNLLAYNKNLQEDKNILKQKFKDRYLTNCNNEKIIKQKSEITTTELSVIADETNQIKNAIKLIDKQLSTINETKQLKDEKMEEFKENVINKIIPNLKENFHDNECAIKNILMQLNIIVPTLNRDLSDILNANMPNIRKVIDSARDHINKYSAVQELENKNIDVILNGTYKFMKDHYKSKNNCRSDLEKFINFNLMDTDAITKIIGDVDQLMKSLSDNEKETLPGPDIKTVLEDFDQMTVGYNSISTCIETLNNKTKTFIKDTLECESSLVAQLNSTRNLTLETLTKQIETFTGDNDILSMDNLKEKSVKLQESLSHYTDEILNSVDNTEELIKSEIIANIIPVDKYSDSSSVDGDSDVPERVSDILPRDTLLKKFKMEFNEDDISSNLSTLEDSDDI